MTASSTSAMTFLNPLTRIKTVSNRVITRAGPCAINSSNDSKTALASMACRSDYVSHNIPLAYRYLVSVIHESFLQPDTRKPCIFDTEATPGFSDIKFYGRACKKKENNYSH